ncbi:MAG: ABC transporter substrate-binding protein [Devosia sp.]
MPTLNRRSFTLGTAGLALGAVLPGRAFAQETRSVTTIYGTYDIPSAPKRVVAIDSRLDLQPALALGLTVVGYGHSQPGSWVPVPEGLEFYGSEVNIEQVLASDPDLIICADYDPDSVWWPANRLREIAPLVPTSGDKPWKGAFREFATLVGLAGAGESAIAEYDALIAEIKERHREKLASKTVVSVQPAEGVLYVMNGSKMLQPQVLADLGAKTIPPKEGQDYDAGETPAEAFAETLGEVDGILLATTSPEDAAMLEGETLWQRLPAVASGALVASNGNINYGSIYSAIQVAKFVDELYGKIA